MAGNGEEDILPPHMARLLTDKLYEKRKTAAVELEKYIKDLLQQSPQNEAKVAAILAHLRKKYFIKTNVNARKGALIAFAAVTMAVKQVLGCSREFMQEVVPPVLTGMTDEDARVRYFACEAMLNIARTARGNVLPFFNRLFDALCKLAADSDPNVRNGIEPLDRTLKDLVTEHGQVDVESFVPLLRDRIRTTDPRARRFLVSWLQILNAVPDLDLISELPKFLSGLFEILEEPTAEINRLCLIVCKEFLKALPSATHLNTRELISIATHYCSSEHSLIKRTAISWVREFLELYKHALLPAVADLLQSILPAMSDAVDTALKELSQTVNQGLLRLVADSSSEELAAFNFDKTLTVLVGQLAIEAVDTRLAALRWLLMLREKMHRQVIDLDLEVFAEMSSSDDDDAEDCTDAAQLFFEGTMANILKLFDTDRTLLAQRGAYIIRTFCRFLGAERVYRSLAGSVLSSADPEFAPVMVQHLNVILLTATELSELRLAIRQCWCFSPVSTLSLCLLGQVYDHACDVLAKCGQAPPTVSFLVEVDKLVQLLESPIFTYLRLQLLEPHTYSYLIKCLYGLLMLLPQSTAFMTLKTRLEVMPVVASTLGDLDRANKDKSKGGNIGSGLPFAELLAHYDQIQARATTHVHA